MLPDRRRELVGASDDDGDSETVRACPHCESASISRRVGSGLADQSSNRDRWKCNTADCYETFDEPVERPPVGERPDGHEKLRRAGFGHLIDDGGDGDGGGDDG
jgi:hypothetical protein